MIVQIGLSRIELTQGDITTQQVDAIVNAANAQLAGGGGVDGAIQRAGGPDIMQETRSKYPDGCETGSAVISSAGNLPVRFIIHAVGPIWRGGHKGEPALLQSAYHECLRLAIQNQCSSVAFPAISTGIYRYPIDLAAETTLQAIRDFLQEHQNPELVRIVLFDPGSYAAFARVLEEMLT